VGSDELAGTFLVFVQVRDVRPLVGAHRFGAEEVADSFLLNVDLTESGVQVLLPEDLITVDLIGCTSTGRVRRLPFMPTMTLIQSVHTALFFYYESLLRKSRYGRKFLIFVSDLDQETGTTTKSYFLLESFRGDAWYSS